MDMLDIQIQAAIQAAADKIVSSGMTLQQAEEYVKENAEQVARWVVKLIIESGDLSQFPVPSRWLVAMA